MKKIKLTTTISKGCALIIVLLLTLFYPASAQQSAHFSTRPVVIDIQPDSSSLMINGNTNVNSFECTFKGTIRDDSLRVKIAPNDSVTTLRGAHLKLRVRDFDCGRGKMNKDFYDLMKANENPFIYMDVAAFWEQDKSPGKDSVSTNSLFAETIFTLAGATNKYLVDITTRKDTDVQSKTAATVLKGEHQLDITDFGLEPPTKFLGLVKVDKKVTIQFKIVMDYHIKSQS